VKKRSLLSILVGGMLLAGLAFIPFKTAFAQCGGPNDPPCPAPGEKQKKPPPVSPAATPTPLAPTKTPIIQAPVLPGPGPNEPISLPTIPPIPPLSQGGGTLPDVPPGPPPWISGAGILLLGVLIGLLIPFRLGSFFVRPRGGISEIRESPLGKGTPGGGDVNPSGLSEIRESPLGKGTPGGGDINPSGLSEIRESPLGKGTPGGGDIDPHA
jgi:hypothetical protein